MLFINFKIYKEGSGKNAIKLAKVMEEISKESGIDLIPVVQAADVREVVNTINLEVWAQNIDAVEYGAHTGATLPESIKDDGAVGTFLNHSEHKFDSFEDLQNAHKRAKDIGLKTLVFAGDLKSLKKNIELKPDFISYEPPELVGSTKTSVSQEKPEVIEKAVKIANEYNIPLIVGAGIKSEEDIRVSLGLGVKGFAIASSIVKAQNPKKEIETLLKGYK